MLGYSTLAVGTYMYIGDVQLRPRDRLQFLQRYHIARQVEFYWLLWPAPFLPLEGGQGDRGEGSRATLREGEHDNGVFLGGWRSLIRWGKLEGVSGSIRWSRPVFPPPPSAWRGGIEQSAGVCERK